MRRKVVISTAGSLGDLNPFIALALELKRRGYEPLIASQVEFRAKIEAEGIAFHALRPGVEDVKGELGYDQQTVYRKATNGSSGLPFLVRRIAMPFLRRAYADMMSATQGAALVVTHPSAFAARLAAETRGIKWMSAVLAPFGLMSSCDPPVFSTAPGLALLRDLTNARFDAALLAMVKKVTDPWTAPFQQLRRELGLPPVINPLFEGQFSPYATLALYSRWMGELQPDHPVNCDITGFAFYDTPAGAPTQLPEDLKRFLAEGPPPLVFTLGTALVNDPGDFYERSFRTAEMLGRRAVFLGLDGALGDNAHAVRRSLPSTMIGAGYVPHSLIFPYAEAVVHHGGVGTTAQALRAGKPQLITPFAGDQPDNAMRMCRLGVARQLAPNVYTPRRAAASLAALTRDRSVTLKAGEIGRSVAAERGAAVAADLIEAQVMGEERLRAEA
jgi:UDP:flavonoid glycosyltransferase YjiC (YdhE family)